jgi:hypothetical protein
MTRCRTAALGAVLLAFACASGSAGAATPASAPAAVADYQFNDTYSSSVVGAPGLQVLGPKADSFVTDTVDGVSRTVLAFPLHNGVSLAPTTGLITNRVYSVVVLYEIALTSGWRRILDVKNGTSDTGLYTDGGELSFYDYATAPKVTVRNHHFVQVVLTRNGAGNLVGYVNGHKQFAFPDTGAAAVISPADTLRFFRDNEPSGGASGEDSKGEVARIRIYDVALTGAEVKALDRLPS